MRTKKAMLLGVILLLMLLLGACAAPVPAPVPPPAPAPPPPPVPTPPPAPTLVPAEFEIISMNIKPMDAVAGETVSITAVVENIGGSEGTYAAILSVDGVPVEAKEVPMTAGSSKVITFSLVKDSAGTYEIGVGGLKSTLIVREEAEPVVEKSDNFTETVALLDTPEKLVDFMNKNFSYEYHEGHISYPVEEFFHIRKGDCKDFVTFSSYILEQQGYEAKIVFFRHIKDGTEGGHAVTLFRDKDGKLKYIQSQLKGFVALEVESIEDCLIQEEERLDARVLSYGIIPAGETCVWVEEPIPFQKDEEEVAKIEITFDPNPVPCQDGYWQWRVILTEVNGVGVKLDTLIYDIYIVNQTVPDRQVNDSAWFEQWVPSAYLTTYGIQSTGFGFPCQEVTHAVITVIGTDDNGHKITAEARVDFQNHYKR